jgi:periplasmic divalent cation tolerance protein
MTRVIVFSTCANRREAREIGRELLKRRLAACVNVLPISSFYWWRGKVRSGSECLLIIKTRAQVFRKLQARISELSSYEVPEIVSVKISNGLPSYLKWIDKETHTRVLETN